MKGGGFEGCIHEPVFHGDSSMARRRCRSDATQTSILLLRADRSALASRIVVWLSNDFDDARHPRYAIRTYRNQENTAPGRNAAAH